MVNLPSPYFSEGGISIYLGDSREILPLVRNGGVVVSDPPFNVGYHYDTYADNVEVAEYRNLLRTALTPPAVMIHYPEDSFRIATWLGEAPSKCVAWVYHANTPRQWRLISWFGLRPDFSLIRQPYRNPTDKRVSNLIKNGSQGSALYDWWQVEQIKNVSDEKTVHPCQMPLDVMSKVIGITPASLIIDPFMGSGTTLMAARKMGRQAIGIDISEAYCDAAANRLSQRALPLTA